MRIYITLLYSILFLCAANADKEIQFYFYKADNVSAKSAVAIIDRKTTFNIEFPKSYFTETFTLPDPISKIYFLPEALPKNEKVPKGAPSITIPKSWKKILVLASKDDKNPIFPVKFTAINANEENFDKGDIMFINSTKQPIFGEIAGDKLNLKSSSVKIVKAPVKGNVSYPAEFFTNKNVEKKFIIRRTWKQSDIARQLIFFYNDEKKKRVAYNYVPVYGM